MINGERIKQVRELQGLTQAEFAKSIGVHQSEIAQIETGRITPGEDILHQIAFRTGFPPAFFQRSASVEFPLGSLLYRARASITAKERGRAYQFARTIFEVVDALQNHKNLINKIPLHLPSIDDQPENAAIQTRSALGLSPDRPIDNLIYTAEKNGVIVLALPTHINKIDAFSLWVGQQRKQPLVALVNDETPGDRLRFSVAHEIGHLVVHQTIIRSIKEMDREADAFAAEFLMPREAMLEEFAPPVTLLVLMRLKTKWKVSIAALIRRAFTLEVISDVQYRYLMYQLSSRYGRTKEPIDIDVEKPRLLGKLVETLYGSPIDYKSLASYMNLPPKLVQDTMGLHMTSHKPSAPTESKPGGTILEFPI